MRDHAAAVSAAAQPLWAALSATALAAGLVLAWHHPLWPFATVLLFLLWVGIGLWRADLWLFVVPAALPVLNLSPWTGWVAFEEFDLLVLGAIAAGLARLAAANPARASPPRSNGVALAGLFSAIGLVGLGLIGIARGVIDAGGWTFGWFDSYDQPLNTVRVAKSLVFALLSWPVLQAQFERDPTAALRRLWTGMQTGLAIVGIAVLYERAAYPGLIDFSSRYRTTATFWEMHVGGAAIDAYLALATPFAAWALWSARSRGEWARAAVLALLTTHACLTTFSRGVYAATAAPLVLLGLVLWARRLGLVSTLAWRSLLETLLLAMMAAIVLIAAFVVRGHIGVGVALLLLLTLLFALRGSLSRIGVPRAAAIALALALMTEAVVVVGGGTFMRERLSQSERDLGSRLEHWKNGLTLLDGATDWLVGLGLGRLPSNYARFVLDGEFSGAVRFVQDGAGRQHARVSGPPTQDAIGGLYALTQRVALPMATGHRLKLAARVQSATLLYMSVCERQLLYAARCQGNVVRVMPAGEAWQDISVPLRGPALAAGPWYAPRLGLLAISVIGAGTAAELASVSLSGPDGIERLENRAFARGGAHWFAVEQSYFLPWHIDYIALEILIERGVLGLAVFLALMGFALWRLASASDRADAFAPFLAASLMGALLVGVVSSVMDVPRIAFLLSMLVLVALQRRPWTNAVGFSYTNRPLKITRRDLAANAAPSA
jgi:hypothetical protein